MFKISRLTDYGVVILRYLAKKGGASSARDLAELSGLPLPTVSKILKLMAKHKLVTAKRGSNGGYELVESLKTISLLRLIEIFEGPPAITSCMVDSLHKCQIHQACPQRDGWHMVHQRVAEVLNNISLFELIGPSSLRAAFPKGVV